MKASRSVIVGIGRTAFTRSSGGARLAKDDRCTYAGQPARDKTGAAVVCSATDPQGVVYPNSERHWIYD